MEEEALKTAIDIAGGASALARALKINNQAVRQWKKSPPARVLEIERITGVSRHALRPDFYPPPEKE